jgi:Gpi18-like mannosyltransferase
MLLRNVRNRNGLLAAALAAAFLFRIFLAPHTGYAFDVGVSKLWAVWPLLHGFGDIYTNPSIAVASFPSYVIPIYLLSGLGWLAQTLGVSLASTSLVFTVFVKFPGMLGDFALAAAVWRFARRTVGQRLALIAAGGILVHPVIWYDSAVWGQMDSLYAALLVFSMDLGDKGRCLPAWLTWVLAVCTKLQSIVLFPLLCFLSIERQGVKKTVKNMLFAALFGFAICLPYLVRDPIGVFENMLTNTTRYPYLTVNAMNIWWPVAANVGMATQDAFLLFPQVSARAVGLFLFGAVTFVTLTLLHKRRSSTALFASASILSVSFFLLLTQMHERYLYPAVPFLLLLALRERRAIVPLVIVSSGLFVNLVAVLPLFTATGGVFDAAETVHAYIPHAVWISLLSSLGFLLWLLFRQPKSVVPSIAESFYTALLCWARAHTFFLLATAILVLGFGIRFAALTHQGYEKDIALSKAWGEALAQDGFEHLGDLPNAPITYFPNYALTLYLWKGIATCVEWLTAHGRIVSVATYTALVKIPGMLGDVLVAGVFLAWGRRYLTGRRRVLPAALFLFSLGTAYDTAVWGQVDSVHAGLVLAAAVSWVCERRSFAFVLFVAAVFCKVQSIIFLPVFLVLLAQDVGLRRACRDMIPAGLVAVFVGTLPYLLAVGPRVLLLGSIGSLEKYPFLTLNAMNIWWPITRLYGQLVRDDLGTIQPLYIGFTLFVVAVITVCVSLQKQRTNVRLFEALALIALAFFLFPTEMHERYLFPFFVFAAIPAAESKRWFVSFLILSVSFLINLIVAAPILSVPWLPSLADGFSPLIDVWWAVNLAVFGFLLHGFVRRKVGE